MSDSDLESMLAGFPADAQPNDEHRLRLRARALEVFEQSSRRPPTLAIRLYRKGTAIMSHPVSRYMTAAAAVVGLSMWLLSPRASVAAFSELIKPMLEAKSARFKVVIANELAPKQEFRAFFLAPNRMRQELATGVSIWDFDEGRAITLIDSAKQALVFEIKKPAGKKVSQNFFGDIRALLASIPAGQESGIAKLAEKELQGHQVIGYQVEQGVQTVKIWGDKKTGRLVLLESEFSGPPKMTASFTDFEFDVPLDESLFKLEAPKGYAVLTTPIDATPPTETDFIATLREIATSDGGKFPAGLDAASIGLVVAKTLMPKGRDDKEPSNEEMQKMMMRAMSLGRGLSFATSHPTVKTAHYAGKGATLTGAKKAIFWYKPKDAATWRVIYSDLSAADSTEPPKN